MERHDVADRDSAERHELPVEPATPTGHRIHVVGEKGEDLADVLVRTLDDSIAGEWITGGDGSCHVPLPPAIRKFEILLEKEGYVHRRRFRSRRDQDSIRLQPATTLFGYVVDEESKLALPRATITYDHADCFRCEPDVVTTDETGAYELPGLPRGSKLTFEIRAEGMADDLVSFEIREAVERLQHDFELGRGVHLRGEVVSHPRGTPIAGASLRLWSHELTTDEEGRFEARLQPRLPLFRTVIEVDAPGHCSIGLLFPEEEFERDGSLYFRLPEAATLAGRVSDPGGEPVAAALVQLSSSETGEQKLEGRGQDATAAARLGLPAGTRVGGSSSSHALTGKDGRFKIGGLVYGDPSLRLGVRADGFEPHTFEVPPTTLPGETLEMEFVLAPKLAAPPPPGVGHLSGRVTVHGEPAAGGVSWRGATRYGHVSLEEDGSYEVDDIEAGTVELAAWAGEEGVWVPDLCEGARVRVEIEPEQRARHDFALEPRYSSISGRVRYEDGRPAPGFEVDLALEESRLGVSMENDPDGSFSFDVLDGGRPFRVSVYCLREVYSRDVEPGASVDLVLPDLGKLLLRVRDARTDRNLEQFTAGWRRTGEMPFRTSDFRNWKPKDPEGWAEIRLPVGSLDLIVHAGPWGYLSVERPGVLVTSAEAGTRVEVLLEQGLTAGFAIASGMDPLPPEHELLVVELAVDGEPADLVAKLHDRYPDYSWVYRRAWFGETRTAEVRGLAPGNYRLLVVPDDLELQPTQIEVREGDEEPTELRWSWK